MLMLKKPFRKQQAGFTLLELLVVVAILAAIAGTATIALRDTDARASAAAHVAMMDELNKGVRTFRVLRKNTLPSNFDSILETDAAPAADAVANATAVAAGADQVLSIAAIEDLAIITLNDALAEQVHAGGMDELQYVSTDATADPEGEGDCSDVEALVANVHNAVVAGNVFMSPAANGCGVNADVLDESVDPVVSRNLPVAIWTGGYERVLGDEGREFDVTPITTDGTTITAADAGAPILMAVGAGPSSNLFNQDQLGGMTTVPIYRHVSETEYNRFVMLFYIGEWDGAAMIQGSQNMHLAAVVDGAGDTKEEELGEWDGTRNTI